MMPTRPTPDPQLIDYNLRPFRRFLDGKGIYIFMGNGPVTDVAIAKSRHRGKPLLVPAVKAHLQGR
jgi:hypothetical protein